METKIKISGRSDLETVVALYDAANIIVRMIVANQYGNKFAQELLAVWDKERKKKPKFTADIIVENNEE